MIFTIMLVISIITAVIYQKAEKALPTIAIACIPIEIISFGLLLVFAPWQFQLLLLVLLLLSYGYWKPNVTD